MYFWILQFYLDILKILTIFNTNHSPGYIR